MSSIEIGQLKVTIGVLEQRLARLEERHEKLKAWSLEIEDLTSQHFSVFHAQVNDMDSRLATVEDTLFPEIPKDLNRVDEIIGKPGEGQNYELDHRTKKD